MSTYVIGDVHGCYDQLQELLVKIKFKPKIDNLWFTGDLINGGPKSLETLRFIKSLGDNCIVVLGNHDLVFLAVAAGKVSSPRDRKFGFNSILTADDLSDLSLWLLNRPLIHYAPKFNVLLVHAGVLPQWDLSTIISLAEEVENMLRGPHCNKFFANMYGNTPDMWHDSLEGHLRLRFVVNCFTRMRFCDLNGKLEFNTKGDINTAPHGFFPWFKIPNRKTANVKIIFGHWAALLGHTGEDNAIGIDTGCVWGHGLTAIRLEDWQRFFVKFK